MDRITEKRTDVSDLSRTNLDLYIRECRHCAQTCRAWAETFAGGAGKNSVTIDACLNCARACEAMANSLLLDQQGIRNVHQAQIEACVTSCRVCAKQCEQRAKNFEGLSVCAKAARRCEEMLLALIGPKVYRIHGSKFFTFFRGVLGK